MIVFLWLLFGLASATIAYYKGHSFIGWLLLGVLFGPFAVVVIAFIPANHPEPVVQAEVEEGMERVCPRCRSWIPCAASVCRFCRSEVTPDLDDDEGDEQRSQPTFESSDVTRRSYENARGKNPDAQGTANEVRAHFKRHRSQTEYDRI